MSDEIKYPEKQFRMPRGISTAIWSRQVEEHGQTRTKFSVKLQKSTCEGRSESVAPGGAKL